MKKLLIFVLLPVVLLIGAGLGAALMGLVPDFGLRVALGLEAPAEEKAKPKPKIPDTPPPLSTPAAEKPIFMQLDQFVVSLRSSNPRPILLLITISLELKDDLARKKAVDVQPHLRSALNIYLSSLCPDSVAGADGINTIRTGVWRMLQKTLPPADLVNVQVMKLAIK